MIKTFLFFLFFINVSSTYAQFRYSESAMVFELMEQVSKWDQSTKDDHQRAWVNKYGPFGSDIVHIKEYRLFREKTFTNDRTKGPEGNIFGEGGHRYNALSHYFYESKSVSEALKRMSKKYSKKDVQFLSSFYRHFLSQITKLAGKESTSFKSHEGKVNKLWSRARAPKLIKKFSKFLGLRTSGKKGPLLRPVWAPKGSGPTIEAQGPFLLLNYYPLDEPGLWKQSDLLKEALRALLIAQPANQKENLSKIFNSRCAGRGQDLVDALLVIWSEILPKKIKNKKEFDLYQRWHRKNFLDLYIKLLFPVVEQEIKNKGKIGGSFIHKAGKLCAQLHNLSVQ